VEHYGYVQAISESLAAGKFGLDEQKRKRLAVNLCG
jgi:hypothetical protein